MGKDTVIILTVAAVLFAVAGQHHGKHHHSYAYNQGFNTGTAMRQRGPMGMKPGTRALLRYCRQAPYTADIPARYPAQWLAGYDAGCDGR